MKPYRLLAVVSTALLCCGVIQAAERHGPPVGGGILDAGLHGEYFANADLAGKTANDTLAVKDGNPLLERLLGREIKYDTVFQADQETPGLLRRMRDGPLAGVEEIIFAVRGRSKDYHYYASQGYLYQDAGDWQYGIGGGKLCRLNLRTGALTALLDDKDGGVRDPAVSYDARTILFSYRKGGTHRYHLYEINADGGGLRQITDGDFDDIEPCYLPDGGIAFCSTRSFRWVNCWHVQATTLYRCDADGKNVYRLSENIEPDNTPAVLPDGRIIYTRWEYVDRHNTSYHDLWTVNPDGTDHMVYWGNNVRPIFGQSATLDARPIPETREVVAVSGGHGNPEHNGYLLRIDPAYGPDGIRGLSLINRSFAAKGVMLAWEATAGWRDPYPITEDCYLVACLRAFYVIDGRGQFEAIYRLPAPAKDEAGVQNRVWVHEPRPLVPRLREPIISSRVDWAQTTGRMLLQNVGNGRWEKGKIQEGEIRSLLVLENLPRPVGVNSPAPLTWAGSWSLARILGVVPVEADGSAYFEVPAMRAVYFVALDKDGQEIKRMKSFANVMPGETLGCVGCHEYRTGSPLNRARPLALLREPAKLTPLADVPPVIDFPRDIQPVLDRHCVGCHNPDRFEGQIDLSGDRTFWFSQSYLNLVLHKQFPNDSVLRAFTYGNDGPNINRQYPLEAKLNGSHHDVKPSDGERRLLWAWLRSGPFFAGTYAALDSGRVFPSPRFREGTRHYWTDNYAVAGLDTGWLKKNCGACHIPKQGNRWNMSRQWRWLDMAYLSQSPHNSAFDYGVNLTRPELSLLLRAPLAKAAGGLGLCPRSKEDPTPFFKNKEDPDYRNLLATMQRGHEGLNRIKRFDMPGFRPTPAYMREMKRYGILPPEFDAEKAPIDVYQTDERYWRSFWPAPAQPAVSGEHATGCDPVHHVIGRTAQ
jgi:hypothetical protein